MAKSATFECSVITPERVVLKCEATFAAFPAHDGDVGILRNRAPLVCKLGIGILRIESPGAKNQFFVDGGFAQVVHNRLSILTAQARPPAEIDAASASKLMVEARAMKVTDESSFAARQGALQRARVQLKLAQKR